MTNEAVNKKGYRRLNIALSLLWFAGIFVLTALNLLYTVAERLPDVFFTTSGLLFLALYILVPSVIWHLPILIRFIFKKPFRKALFISICVTIVYILLFVSLQKGLTVYFSDFSQSKWNNYISNRHLMINDLENDYKIIGMDKTEVTELLGQPSNNISGGSNVIIYHIRTYDFAWYKYHLTLENGKVIKTEVVKINY